MKKVTKNGFTLIELLVVISIIGVLSAVILTAVGSARQKANDARRAEDLREIQKAVQMYFSDKGAYPVNSGTCSSVTGDTGWSTAFKNALVPAYISSLPEDPHHELASCNATDGWNNYYGFASNMSWTWGNCIGNTGKVVLYTLGDTTSKKTIDECASSNNTMNTIVIQ